MSTRTTTNGLSFTDNLHFAAYLDASGRLTFVGCVPAGIGDKIVFRFRDPRREIDRLFEEYAAGAVVPAIDLSTSLRALRRAMGAASTVVSTAEDGAPYVARQP